MDNRHCGERLVGGEEIVKREPLVNQPKIAAIGSDLVRGLSHWHDQFMNQLFGCVLTARPDLDCLLQYVQDDFPMEYIVREVGFLYIINFRQILAESLSILVRGLVRAEVHYFM